MGIGRCWWQRLRSRTISGLERHVIRGRAKRQTRVDLALAVMMAMALGHVKAGRIGQMGSLVRPNPATR
jgi:hypothetical protein